VSSTVPAPSVGGSRAALAFVFVTVTIDILAFGIIIPVLPHLVQDFVGGSIAKASVWSGIFSTVFATTQFVCSPIQGALSDRFGRRVVILLSCLGLGLDFALMALVNTLPLLLVGRVISGITAASFSTANAYIADVTPPDKRAGAFGMLGAAFGIGFVVGPAIGGFLSGYGVRAPFWGAAVLALCNFAYGLFVLPESLPPEKRSKRIDWSHANPFGALLRLRRYPQVLGLAVVTFLWNLAHYVLPAIFVLYADYRYQWGARSVGYVLGGVGLCGAIVPARPRRQSRGADRRAAHGGHRSDHRHDWFRHLRTGAEWTLVPARHTGDVPLGPREPRDAGADEPTSRPRRTGATPRGRKQLGESCRHLRAVCVRELVRCVDRFVRALPPSGRRVSGLGISRLGRRHHGVARDGEVVVRRRSLFYVLPSSTSTSSS